MATFKLKLKTKHCRKSPCILFDLEKLTDPKDAEIFQAQVGGKFAYLNMLVTLTFDINEVLLTTVEKVLGKPQKIIQLWITKDILDFCEKR